MRSALLDEFAAGAEEAWRAAIREEIDAVPPFVVPVYTHCERCEHDYVITAERFAELNIEVLREHGGGRLAGAGIWCTGCGTPVWGVNIPMDYVWREEECDAPPGALHRHTVIFGRVPAT